MSFAIPLVDISEYLLDPNSAEANNVVEKIRRAAMTSGFFQITGHQVSSDAQRKVLQAAQIFFSLPLEAKKACIGVRGRGYELIGSQTLDPGTAPDLKEGYFVGRDDPSRQPPYRDFEHPNIWPSSYLQKSDFQDPILQYHEALSDLSYHIMLILARGLNASRLGTEVFKQFCKEPVASVRLLHYPPHPDTQDPSVVGAGAHTDFGAITLLLQQPGTSGLQVQDPDTKQWIDVPYNEAAYVVNVGDMITYWTRGVYKSSVHRVINTSGTDRYSVPFFFDGNLDCVLKPLDGHGGPSMTVLEHLSRRYDDVYIP